MTGLDPATARALSHRLAREQAERRLPSVAAGLVRDGTLVWSDTCGRLDGRADGPTPDSDTQYRIGSISKTFVAVEVLRLRDEGRLDLGETVETHLPGTGLGPVTIAQLLTHTSGLQAETDGPWWERTPGGPWEELAASSLSRRFTPGTRFHYSNVGFAVLGEIVSRLRGEPWIDAVQRGVLDPLGMRRTTTRPSEPAAPGLAVHPFADLVLPEPEHDGGSMAPAGQLWSTVGDLARWAAFVAGDTGDVLSADTLAETLRPVAVNDVPEKAWGGAQGLGWNMWNVDGRRFAGHGGSMPGFLAVLRVDLTTGDGVVIMTNATSGLGTAHVDLLALLAEREPHAPEPWTADGSQADGLDLAGTWFWGTIAFTLALLPDGGLRLGEPGEGRGARFARDDDGWVGLEGYYAGEPLVVRRDAAGHPVQLDLASFVFTRTPYDPAAEIPGDVDPDGWR